jgi:hypothetical protein
MDIRDILQKIDQVQNPKELTSEIQKSNLTEAAAISVNMYGNNPDEVQALYQIFKNAGLQSPVPAVVGPVSIKDEETPVGEDDRYQASTTPDPKYATIPDTVDPTSDDLHKKKKMYARSQPGDNPMAVKEEEISLAEKIKSQLTQDYAAYKEGAVKGMVMDMEQDAAEMNKDEFIKKHGQRYVDIWDRVNSEEDQFDGNTEDIDLE